MSNEEIINESIILTNDAAKRVSAILSGEDKKGYFLRVSVSNSGCSGMSYNLTFDNKEEDFILDFAIVTSF